MRGGPGWRKESAAVGGLAVLRSRQDRRQVRADESDLAGSRRYGAVVNDARSQAGVTIYRPIEAVGGSALDDRARPTSQQGFQCVGRIGLGQPRSVGKGCRKP